MLARERWQTFENSWPNTQSLMNTLYVNIKKRYHWRLTLFCSIYWANCQLLRLKLSEKNKTTIKSSSPRGRGVASHTASNISKECFEENVNLRGNNISLVIWESEATTTGKANSQFFDEKQKTRESVRAERKELGRMGETERERKEDNGRKKW